MKTKGALQAPPVDHLSQPHGTSPVRRGPLARLVTPNPDWYSRIALELAYAESELPPERFASLLHDVELLVQRRRRHPRRRARSW